MSGVAGHLALVTGGGSGMGRATCIELATRGATVVAADIDPTKADATAELCRAAGGSAFAAAFDVADDGAVGEAVARIAAEQGAIDIAVACAGTATLGPLVELSDADFDAVVGVSLGGTYSVTRAVLPGMLAAGWGRVIAISSLYGITPVPDVAHYCAAKAAIVGFTQAVALEAAPAVTVNCVCPGNTDTPMIDEDVEHAQREDPSVTAEEVKARFAADIPIGRLARPEEMAAAIAFLAGEEAGFITGTALNATGGEVLR